MSTSRVGFRPMRELDFDHNAGDIELIHAITNAYEPRIYFNEEQPIYTDERSVYGHVAQYGSDGKLATTSENNSVFAFTRIPIPE